MEMYGKNTPVYIYMNGVIGMYLHINCIFLFIYMYYYMSNSVGLQHRQLMQEGFSMHWPDHT